MSEQIIGHSALGAPITAYRFDPPVYAKPKPPALLFAAIHGDEPAGIHCLAMLIPDLLERPPGRVTWIVPVLNIDGVRAGTKNNSRDVDLNRNFAANNWTTEFKAGYNPGPTPESEPETQALVGLIEGHGIERVIALHQPFHIVNWDGRGEGLAREMAALSGYELKSDIGYPTPGSLGSKYGRDQNLEVVTLEIPFVSDDEAWRQNRAALRFACDLPT